MGDPVFMGVCKLFLEKFSELHSASVFSQLIRDSDVIMVDSGGRAKTKVFWEKIFERQVSHGWEGSPPVRPDKQKKNFSGPPASFFWVPHRNFLSQFQKIFLKIYVIS